MILLICFSSFLVTRSSTISGLAQGRVVTTVQIQIFTSGLDSSGKLLADITHAINIMITKSTINLVFVKKKFDHESLSFSSNSNFCKYFDCIQSLCSDIYF